MARIDEQIQFDPDQLSSSVVGIAADVGTHDSGMHQHNKGQLLYAPSGCMSFSLLDSLSVLPPTKAVWIPPNTEHRAMMTNVVAYRSLYFDTAKFKAPDKLTIIEVNELLKALINTMALWQWDKPEHEMTYYTQLFWQEFSLAKRERFELPLPNDRRLNRLMQQLSQDGFLLPELNQLANCVGASSKTISRIFKVQTGMSYQEWKQQWRVLKSIELLCQNSPVSDVAHRMDFSSDSAFIAFFRKQTGQTPLTFVRQNKIIN